MKRPIHVTFEIDMEMEQLRDLLLLLRGFQDHEPEPIMTSIFRRGDVPIAEIEAVHREIWPDEGELTVLRTPEAVDAIKNALRHLTEPKGSA